MQAVLQPLYNHAEVDRGAMTVWSRYGERDMSRFRALCQEHDPDGVATPTNFFATVMAINFLSTHFARQVFRNEWFERLIFDDRQDHLKLVLPAEGV
eukprot:COSAG02_NODE_6014_length_3876_cov_5.093585_2_plen_97_part_00